jgi:hypothetical protein
VEEEVAVGLLKTLKQKAIGLGARVALNKRFARYGTMPQLHVDLTEKHVEGRVMLKGEASPIEFAMDYELGTGVSGVRLEGGAREGQGGEMGPVVTLSNVKLSRAWMQQLAEELVVGKPLAVPPELAVWLRRLGVM